LGAALGKARVGTARDALAAIHVVPCAFARPTTVSQRSAAPIVCSGAGFAGHPREGGRAPTGAGADRRTAVARLAVGPISGSPEITGQ